MKKRYRECSNQCALVPLLSRVSSLPLLAGVALAAVVAVPPAPALLTLTMVHSHENRARESKESLSVNILFFLVIKLITNEKIYGLKVLSNGTDAFIVDVSYCRTVVDSKT